ncbi:MAG: deoxyribonuclease IV [bacterium]
MDKNLLGTHCSISGGIENAITDARSYEIDTFQVFTKNQRQWKDKQYSDQEGERFKAAMKEAGIKVAFSHTIYLINIGSGNPEARLQSIKSLVGEINRCHTLGLAYAVLHPGSNPDKKEGIKLISDSLKQVLDATGYSDVKILLENTAGQGNSIGGNFDELAEIINNVGSERIGVCFDTCHAFVAGYDIRTVKGLDETFKELDEKIGLIKLKAIHLNDSKGDYKSKLDRHDHIGQGKLGILPFKYILERFQNIPKVLETPKVDDMDRVNLTILRNM